MRSTVLSALVLLTAISPAMAQPRAVIELFTSQGCSSCPPADRAMNSWADQADVVALTMPVDYWDYLGWKDTLASHDFTVRQRAYSERRGDRNVYTPQVVVDGLVHAVGSNDADVATAIREAHAKANVLSVPVTISGGTAGYTIAIGAGAGGTKGKVFLVPISRQVKVAIGRGENNGATITYSNVARAMRPIGDYTGAALTLTLDAKAVSAPGSDAFAVLVQEIDGGRPAAILGAALQHP